MRKYFIILLLLGLHCVARGQTSWSYSYWFDNDRGTMHTGESASSAWTLDADISSLSDGLHMMHLQIEGEKQSVPMSRYFLKIPQTEAVANMTFVSLIDGKEYKKEQVAATGSQFLWQFDVSELKQGLHQIQVLGITESGAATSSYSSFFLKTPLASEVDAMKLYYTVDDDQLNIQEGTRSEGGFHFDVDVSQLSDGLRRLTYFMSNGNENTTKVGSQFFWKIPVGGNGVTEYQYWLNDNHAGAQVVTFSERTNPLQLVSLLPVNQEPIRSSCFEFRIVNGSPVVYAKNDFHLRFADAAGRFTEFVRQYVDERVKEEITDAPTLETGVTTTLNKPAANGIKWLKLDAETGDSLQFKLDRAATIQLFSPSGKEVYLAKGAEAVSWGGLHVDEDGTFYMAVHDVASTSVSVLNLDYTHIDKYAVLRQDVATVGNGGASTITFDGNGFDELTTVELRMGSNVIHSAEVEHKGDARIAVKFDFSGVALGQYDAVFHFAGEDIVREHSVTVEEALPFEFEESVSFASVFLESAGNDYVFKVRNKSNMTAYNVPLAIYIYTPTETDLTSVEIGGFDLTDHLRQLVGEQNASKVDAFKARDNGRSGDLCFFIKEDGTSYVQGSPYLHYAFISPDLRPNTDETFTVSVKSTDVVSVYMWCPDEWGNEGQTVKHARRKSIKDGLCAIANERNRQCAENKQMAELGYGPIYNVDCSNLTTPAGCDSNGGTSSPAKSMDPNDIYGYQAESGSKAVREGLKDVYYTIEFENDPEFATASAHDIVITDQLDATKFDLTTFAPTSIKIGDKTAELSGEQNYVTTVDMRPAINAIAQITGSFDSATGVAQWHITSLDPMTMEPTDEPMDGVLPVNADGNGIGQVMFNISLKDELLHGTEVPNQASIVFDTNEPIMTPVWTNVIDRIAPESHVLKVERSTEDKAIVSMEATDDLSGVWRYDVYVQQGIGSVWFKIAENVPAGTEAEVKIYEGINHGFCVVATDMAGNVEQKELKREFTLNLSEGDGDVNGNGQLDIGDAVSVVNYLAGKPSENFVETAADMNKNGKIDIGDAVSILNVLVGKVANSAPELTETEDTQEPQ